MIDIFMSLSAAYRNTSVWFLLSESLFFCFPVVSNLKRSVLEVVLTTGANQPKRIRRLGEPVSPFVTCLKALPLKFFRLGL